MKIVIRVSAHSCFVFLYRLQGSKEEIVLSQSQKKSDFNETKKEVLITEKVKKLLKKMTLKEKLSQIAPVTLNIVSNTSALGEPRQLNQVQ